jgi:hypothetical protein
VSGKDYDPWPARVALGRQWPENTVLGEGGEIDIKKPPFFRLDEQNCLIKSRIRCAYFSCNGLRSGDRRIGEKRIREVGF